MDRKRNWRTDSGTNCYRAQRNIASLSAVDCRAAYSTSIDNQRVGKAIDIWCRSNQRCAIKTCDVRLQSIVCGVGRCRSRDYAFKERRWRWTAIAALTKGQATFPMG